MPSKAAIAAAVYLWFGAFLSGTASGQGVASGETSPPRTPGKASEAGSPQALFEDEPAAHALFDRVLSTMREADTLYYESDYRWEIQEVARSLSQGSYKLWVKDPGFTRLEADSAHGERKGVLVADGKHSWVHWPTGRPAVNPPFEKLEGGQGENDRFTSYMQWPAPQGPRSPLGTEVQCLGVGLYITVLDPSMFHGNNPLSTVDAVRSLGTEKVGEEECDVIEASHMNQQFIRRLWVSRRDHLPRKLKQTMRPPGMKITTITHEVWSNVRINEEIPSDRFRWQPPEDWTRYYPNRRARQEPPTRRSR